MAAKDRPFTMLAAQICGFDDKLNAGLCPICGVKPDESKLRDERALAEFQITGICMKCQDFVFTA